MGEVAFPRATQILKRRFCLVEMYAMTIVFNLYEVDAFQNIIDDSYSDFCGVRIKRIPNKFSHGLNRTTHPTHSLKVVRLNFDLYLFHLDSLGGATICQLV